mmetsp:Transcript_27213/g.71648  ORF Transcript_27213/g.71648 Transcript_27213/m.71648 type:complete len:129 (+) Transcript_27213:2735-3121(+)
MRLPSALSTTPVWADAAVEVMLVPRAAANPVGAETGTVEERVVVEVDVVATQVEAVGRCHHKRKRTSSMCNSSSITSISNRCKAHILPDCLTYRTGVVQASPVEILRRVSGSFLTSQYFFRLCGPTHL